MYSKIFKSTGISNLEKEFNKFLKELAEVTGEIVHLKLFKDNEEIIILLVYSCWKQL
jgi:DNA-binding IclR family transcriptional regulator